MTKVSTKGHNLNNCLVLVSNLILFYCFKKVRDEIERLDPFIESTGTGMLGRMSDVLTDKGYKVKAYGIDTDLAVLEGKRKDTFKLAVNSETSFKGFNPSGLDDDFGKSLKSNLSKMNRVGDLSNNVFSDTISDSMVRFDCFLFAGCDQTMN